MLLNKYLNLIIIMSLAVLISLLALIIMPLALIWEEDSVTLSELPELRQVLILDMINKYNPKLSVADQVAITRSIIKESNLAGLDPLLVTSVIAAESSFIPTAISPCDAQGLMQITDGVARWMQVKDPYDIQENISAGSRYLSYLFNRFNNYELAIAAYNAGSTRVARLGKIPPFKETICYVKRVAKTQQRLKQGLPGVFANIMSVASFIPHSLLQPDLGANQLFSQDRNQLEYTPVNLYLSEQRSPSLFPFAV